MDLFQSWEAMDGDTATFTPDITPLILAAHTDNYEVQQSSCSFKLAFDTDNPYEICTNHSRFWIKLGPKTSIIVKFPF